MEQESPGCCSLSFTPLHKAVTYWVMNRRLLGEQGGRSNRVTSKRQLKTAQPEARGTGLGIREASCAALGVTDFQSQGPIPSLMKWMP